MKHHFQSRASTWSLLCSAWKSLKMMKSKSETSSSLYSTLLWWCQSTLTWSEKELLFESMCLQLHFLLILQFWTVFSRIVQHSAWFLDTHCISVFWWSCFFITCLNVLCLVAQINVFFLILTQFNTHCKSMQKLYICNHIFAINMIFACIFFLVITFIYCKINQLLKFLYISNNFCFFLQISYDILMKQSFKKIEVFSYKLSSYQKCLRMSFKKYASSL